MSAAEGLSEEENALSTTLLEALELAKEACHYDATNEIVKACDTYDRSILLIDEILSKLLPNSTQWGSLLEIRNKYDDRMEYLRAVESTKYDGGSSSTLKQIAFSNNRKKRQCHVAFEVDEQLLTFCATENDYNHRTIPEPPPTSSLQLPYWQMRVIMNTITNGGFVTPTVFVPKSVWVQLGVKFSGLSTKTAAFQEIISVLTNYLFPLTLPATTTAQTQTQGQGQAQAQDTTSKAAAPLSDIVIYQLLTALRSCREEFHKLQNSLAKPFPFINEIKTEDDFDTNDSSTNSGGGKGQVSTKLTSMVSMLGKNVRKYAEQGYQRFGTLSSHISEDDFAAYTALLHHLCDRCQLLDTWRKVVEKERDRASNLTSSQNGNPGQKNQDDGDDDEETELAFSSSGIVETATKSSNNLLELMNEALLEFSNISMFMREVVCEILIRDVEALVERYMQKMRKSFSRMYWDREDDHAAAGHSNDVTSDSASAAIVIP